MMQVSNRSLSVSIYLNQPVQSGFSDEAVRYRLPEKLRWLPWLNKLTVERRTILQTA